MGLTEQKQAIAQRLRDGISIRAIAAEVGVDKGTVLLAKQKIKPYSYRTFIKKAMFTQLKFLIFGSLVLSSVYEFFFWQP
jgi:IS30 family transposase